MTDLEAKKIIAVEIERDDKDRCVLRVCSKEDAKVLRDALSAEAGVVVKSDSEICEKSAEKK